MNALKFTLDNTNMETLHVFQYIWTNEEFVCNTFNCPGWYKNDDALTMILNHSLRNLMDKTTYKARCATLCLIRLKYFDNFIIGTPLCKDVKHEDIYKLICSQCEDLDLSQNTKKRHV